MFVRAQQTVTTFFLFSFSSPGLLLITWCVRYFLNWRANLSLFILFTSLWPRSKDGAQSGWVSSISNAGCPDWKCSEHTLADAGMFWKVKMFSPDCGNPRDPASFRQLIHLLPLLFFPGRKAEKTYSVVQFPPWTIVWPAIAVFDRAVLASHIDVY